MHYNKVLAIQCYGPSGSLLLQSLLDGHPQILSTPALYMRELYRFWDEQAPFTSIYDLVDKFINSPYHAYWFTPDKGYRVLDQVGLLTLGKDANENIIIDKNTFVNFFLRELQDQKISEITTRTLIIAVYIAYNLTIGRPVNPDMWLLFPIHANPAEHAIRLKNDFPIVRIIHMVRNPVTLYYSILKCLTVEKCGQHNRLACALFHAFYDKVGKLYQPEVTAYGFQPYFKDDENVQSRAVRLEDLHSQPKENLLRICQWLDIKWDDCLLESTFNGKLWNNKGHTVKVNGFGDQAIINQYESAKTKLDIIRLSALFKLHYNAFDYTAPFDEKKIKKVYKLLPLWNLLPFKIELKEIHFFLNYIRNRIILYKMYKHTKNGTFNFVPLLNKNHINKSQTNTQECTSGTEQIFS